MRCVSLADAHNHNGGADKQMGSGGMYGAAAAAAAMAALPGSHLMQLDLQWIFQFPWRVKLCYNVRVQACGFGHGLACVCRGTTGSALLPPPPAPLLLLLLLLLVFDWILLD